MLSNWLYTSAVGIYMLAALLSAVEYVLGRYSGATVGPRFGRMGVAATMLGAVLHLGSIVLRGLSASRAPWGNIPLHRGRAAATVAAFVLDRTVVDDETRRKTGRAPVRPAEGSREQGEHAESRVREERTGQEQDDDTDHSPPKSRD